MFHQCVRVKRNAEQHTKQNDMRVSELMKLDGLQTIEDLRRALSTVEFYNCPHLYNAFCCGLESGHMRGTDVAEDEIARIEDMLSVGAETHLRAELWYSLSEYDFHHNIGRSHREERVERFKKFGEAVREGREKYGDVAWEKRQSMIALYDGDATEDAAVEQEDVVDEDDQADPNADPNIW